MVSLLHGYGRNYATGVDMRLSVFSALCATAIVAILVVGERTLPLFGGDRALAGRVTAAALMALSGGVLAGVVRAGMRFLARFLRTRIARAGAMADHWRVHRHLPRLFEAAAPWAALALGLGGLGLSVAVWQAL